PIMIMAIAISTRVNPHWPCIRCATGIPVCPPIDRNLASRGMVKRRSCCRTAAGRGLLRPLRIGTLHVRLQVVAQRTLGAIILIIVIVIVIVILAFFTVTALAIVLQTSRWHDL